jgi:NADPH:quinone reductase-like Zn-dependent oxidoreductase
MRAVVCDRWCHYSELRRSGVQGKYQRKPPHPFSPGSEISGVVTEVASGVTGFAPGVR